MKRILFIGHEATRTGAPFVLLYFLEWLKKNKPQYAVDLMLLRGGELIDDFRRAADVYTLPEDEVFPIWRRGFERLKKRCERRRFAPFFRDYDLVAGNTMISLDWLETFKQKGVPTVCWLHELDYAVGLFSIEKFVRLSGFVDSFIVPSRANEKMLRRFGIEKPAHLVYEFSKIAPPDGEDIEAVKKELGVPPGAFVIGGSGTIEWRKGVDWFLQLAARLPNFYFVWVGGKSPYSDTEYNQVRHDFERLNLSERVIFTGRRENPQKFYAAMDLFALTSREDPFPLVCLEAASLAKPIICFADAGGMPEFVESDAGAIVPYGDLAAFCEKINYFYERPDALAKAGQAALAKVNTRFTAEKSCAALEKILSDCLK